MATSTRTKKKIVSIAKQNSRDVKSEKSAGEMYPIMLLEPQLTRRRRRQRWVNAEIKQLQFTFAKIPEIA